METAKDILIAMLICFGLLYLLVKQLPDSMIRNPWATETNEAIDDVKQVIPADGPQAPLARTTAGSGIDRDDSAPPISIDQLRADCVAEVKRGGSVSWRSEGACARYERAVAGVGDPGINLSESPHSIPDLRAEAQGPRDDGRVGPTVVPHECRGYGYGTIPYRRCRAAEKKRLLEICRAGTDRAEQSTGSMRPRLKQIALANCRVADLYQIIK